MTEYLSPLDDWLAASPEQLRNQAFQASQFAASEIAEQGIKADTARDIVIRLLALAEQRPEVLVDFLPMIESLTREVGLFPYIDISIQLLHLLATGLPVKPLGLNQTRTLYSMLSSSESLNRYLLVTMLLPALRPVSGSRSSLTPC